jgi:hypothetical protein
MLERSASDLVILASKTASEGQFVEHEGGTRGMGADCSWENQKDRRKVEQTKQVKPY